MTDASKLFHAARAQSGTRSSPGEIPPEAVQLYRRSRELRAAGLGPADSPAWEEYRVVSRKLRLMFDLKPWNEHFLECRQVDPDTVHPADREEFRRIRELRQELEAALSS